MRVFCVCVCFLSLSLSSIPACFFLVCYFASFLFLRSGCGVCVASAVVWAVWQQMAKRIPPVSTTKVAPAMVPLLAWLALLLLCHAGQGMAALSCFAIGREQPAWPGATIVTPAGSRIRYRMRVQPVLPPACARLRTELERDRLDVHISGNKKLVMLVRHIPLLS